MGQSKDSQTSAGKARPDGADSKEPANARKDKAAKRFIDDLLTRGEAARPDKDDKLPPGATHEIEEDSESGPPKVKRRRFSAI